MGFNSNIEWTTHTFNPWWGCTKVSDGCRNCYAEALANRYGHSVWGAGRPRRLMSDAHWQGPLVWDADARRDYQPSGHEKYQRLTPTDPDNYAARVLAEQSELFEAGDQELFNQTVMKLAASGDGVDYTVYGFPLASSGSGCF